MRCALPSSKVGSCESAIAAAERASGGDAAVAGFAAAARAAGAAHAGAIVAGLAWAVVMPVSDAPEPVPSANVGAATSIAAMATIVILCMSDFLVRRSWMRARRGYQNEMPDRSGRTGKAASQQCLATLPRDRCVLIKLLLRLLQCRKSPADPLPRLNFRP